ncbi:MAG: DoxX family protein [Candidatus Dadabacteria bacterium]|nr:MAG: DoxX family protein [Candidatus Dadabacteria bacterium]
MKLDQPIGKTTFGPVFIRITLGAYLLMSGLGRFDNLAMLTEQVKLSQVFPENWATVYATLLPYFEVVAGALFLGGFWTTLSSLLVILVVGSYLYIFGIDVTRTDPFNFPIPFNENLIFLGAAISTLFTGPGIFSLDGFRNNSSSS